MLLCNPGRSFVIITQCIYILQLSTGEQPKTDPLSFVGTTKDRSPILSGYNLRQIPFGRRFLFAHICRNSLFIICSLQNSSYCLLSTISGIFTINALLQQPCVPFHFDKQASFATSTPTNFVSKTIKGHYHSNQADYHYTTAEGSRSGYYLDPRSQETKSPMH